MRFILENQSAFSSGKADEALYNQYFALIEKGMATHQTEMILLIVVSLLPVVVNIVAGIFANKFYLNHIKATIAKIKSVIPNPSAYPYIAAAVELFPHPAGSTALPSGAADGQNQTPPPVMP